MARMPCGQRALVTLQRLVVHVVHAAHATLAAAIGGIGLGRTHRWRIVRIGHRCDRFIGIHGAPAGIGE
ncbi:hypothetical protein ASD55_10905 [Rhodanobacter sp. Root561]|nr:hypothetical protein ASD55_10905 [Rhodanobacter sp. Root561]